MHRDDDWVLLAYRLPRTPSTPRSMVWRKLKRLGVVQLGDGLVALPADARTREALEWVAEDIVDHGGDAMLWLARPAERAGQAALVERMTAAVAEEYVALIAAARETRSTDPVTQRRTLARLRRELHRIEARDFFCPPQRQRARRLLDELSNPADRLGTPRKELRR